MTKAKLHLYKLISLNTLALMIIGMFCFGMFTPTATMAAVVDNDCGCSVGCSQPNLQLPLAACCIANRHTDEAVIINPDSHKAALSLGAPAVLTVVSQLTTDFYFEHNTQVEIFPPPDGLALSTIVKRE